MKRYGEDFILDQGLMDTITSRMDEDILEDLRDEIEPCDPADLLIEYIWRDGDFEKLLKDEFGIQITSHDEEAYLAKQIRESDTWDNDQLRRLCRMAGMEDEYNQADAETFESVAYAAANKLGVTIV